MSEQAPYKNTRLPAQLILRYTLLDGDPPELFLADTGDEDDSLIYLCWLHEVGDAANFDWWYAVPVAADQLSALQFERESFWSLLTRAPSETPVLVIERDWGSMGVVFTVQASVTLGSLDPRRRRYECPELYLSEGLLTMVDVFIHRSVDTPSNP